MTSADQTIGPVVSAHLNFDAQDYPLGGNFRGVARYYVESNNRGQRVCRQTEKRTGGFAKPKTSTYADACAILVGEDGRTYAARLHRGYQQVSILDGALKYSAETVHRDSNPERYLELVTLIESAE